MSAAARLPAALAVLLALGGLAGCLDIDQYPAYRDGAYDGKEDMPLASPFYSGDRLAWNAAIVNRNHLQNEYLRTGVPEDAGGKDER